MAVLSLKVILRAIALMLISLYMSLVLMILRFSRLRLLGMRGRGREKVVRVWILRRIGWFSMQRCRRACSHSHRPLLRKLTKHSTSCYLPCKACKSSTKQRNPCKVTNPNQTKCLTKNPSPKIPKSNNAKNPFNWTRTNNATNASKCKCVNKMNSNSKIKYNTQGIKS